MSHKPPLPDAATSPFPLHPAPIEHSDPVADTPAETAEPSATKISGRTIGLAAGAAIGSAAVAAALLFYNRPATPAKRAPAKTRSEAQTGDETQDDRRQAQTAGVKTAGKPRTKTEAPPAAKAKAKPKPKPGLARLGVQAPLRASP